MIDEVLLNQIAKYQILHGSSCSELGLFNGKMGMVLFLFHYARYTGNALHESFANEILDEVLEDTSNTLPISFSTGLCGIGWGIEYLIQKGFAQGNADEILEELDKRVMEYDLRRITNISLDKGLEGIAYYISARLISPRKGKQPFDINYIKELHTSLKKHHLKTMGLNIERVLLYITDTNEVNVHNLSWKYGLKMLRK